MAGWEAMFALRIAHWIFSLLVYIHDSYDLYRKRLTELKEKGGTRGVLRQGIRHGWPFSIYLQRSVVVTGNKKERTRKIAAKKLSRCADL